MVGHVGVGSHSPEAAQRLAGRHDATQRPKVRFARTWSFGRSIAGRALQRAAEQAARAQVRRRRLHLYEVLAAT